MPRWYEAANESSFKPVEGGHVFQKPNPWVFGRPTYYRVDEQQRRTILCYLGRWRLMLMLVPLISMGLALFPLLAPKLVGGLLFPFIKHFGPTLAAPLIFGAIMLLLVPIIAAPQIYLARALAPLLAHAQRTQERITLREQLPKIARATSPRLLVFGLVNGVALLLCAGLMVVAGYLEGDLTRLNISAATAFATMGACLVLYFRHLRKLRTGLAA